MNFSPCFYSISLVIDFICLIRKAYLDDDERVTIFSPSRNVLMRGVFQHPEIIVSTVYIVILVDLKRPYLNSFLTC